jgi:hypothetical protein
MWPAWLSALIGLAGGFIGGVAGSLWQLHRQGRVRWKGHP